MERLRNAVRKLKMRADQLYGDKADALKMGDLHQVIGEIVGGEIEEFAKGNSDFSAKELKRARVELERVVHYLIARLREEESVCESKELSSRDSGPEGEKL